MSRILRAALVAIALAGCQSAPRSTPGATDTPGAPATGADAVTADAPQQIAELTDQTTVWECPKCGMDYDRAGACSMDGAALAETRVSYLCPADDKPVERAGKCPRCPMNARIEKSAVAAAVGEK